MPTAPESLVWLAFACVLASLSRAPQEGLPDAAALLDAADAKVAGAGARSGLQAIVASGAFQAEGMGQGAFEELFLGDKVKFTTEYPGFGEMTQGTDGRLAWSTDPAMGVMVTPVAEQGSVARLYGVSRRDPWRSLYTGAETVGEVELDGRPHYELRMTPAEGEPETWYVDAGSGLVARVDLAMPDFMGGFLPVTYAFSDWKPVDGVLFPHAKTLTAGSYEVHYSYESVELGAAIDAARLAPSEEVLVAAKQGPRTPRPPEQPEACQLESVEARPALSIRVQVAEDEVGPTLAVLLPEVMAHLARTGVSPAGPPFSRYHAIEDGQVDLEAGMTVREEVEGGGRVVASSLPGGRVAVTWHIGHVDQLKRSYDRLATWIADQGLTGRGGFWEVYWTDPGLEPDASKWRTQILWPVE